MSSTHRPVGSLVGAVDRKLIQISMCFSQKKLCSCIKVWPSTISFVLAAGVNQSVPSDTLICLSIITLDNTLVRIFAPSSEVMMY